jgi:hypothetical protein
MNDPSSLPAADAATAQAPGEADPEAAHPASPAGTVAIGDLVITWDDDEPREYGGPSDHPGFTEVSFGLLDRRTPVIKCDPQRVAPAGTPIPARDARVTVEQRPRPERPYGAAGSWRLTLPGQLPSWHKTKRDGTAAGLRQVAIIDWHASRAADATPADVLTPYTVATGTTRAYRVCWINRETLEPGTAAFLDDGQGLVVCAACAAHCTSCTDPDCDHPRYVYAPQASEG